MLPKDTSNCSQCGLQKICFPKGLYRTDILKLEKVIEHMPILEKGEVLFNDGEPFTRLFAIKSGVVKLFSKGPGTEETVQAFYLPGDVLGTDAIASEKYQFYAKAVDVTHVCEIRMDQIERLAQDIPDLKGYIVEVMSREITDTRFHSQVLFKKTAEQKVAYFILNIANRFKAHGYQHSQIRLNILHKDMASYLNLTPETVSRVLAKLTKDGVVFWKKKDLQILNFSKLEKLI